MTRDTTTRRRIADTTTDPTSYVASEDETRRVDRLPGDLPDRPRVATGWDSRSQLRDRVKPKKNYATKVYPEAEKILIRFLEPSFVDGSAVHWLLAPPRDGQPATGKKRPYLCFKSLRDTEDCPFCDELAHRPIEQYSFNVAVWLGGSWGHRMLTLNPNAADLVQAIAEGRLKPINRPGNYFEVYRTGNGSDVKYQNHFDRITTEDIDNDPDVDLLDSEVEEDIIAHMQTDLIQPASDEDVTAAIGYNLRD